MTTAVQKIRVKYTAPSQRRYHRVTAPLHVSVSGVDNPAVDWSVGGLRISPGDVAEFTVNDVVRVTLSLPFHDFSVQVELDARVVRIDHAAAEVALQHINPPQRARELLHYFCDHLLRGEMAPVEGTIRRLDLPTTPPKPQAPGTARLTHDAPPTPFYMSRAFVTGAAYITLGILLAGFFSYMLYNSVFLVKSDQAMVYAPTLDIVSSENGMISEVFVKEGDQVAAGARLLTLDSPRLEQLMSETTRQQSEARIARDRLAALVLSEQRTLLPYRKIAADQVISADARLKSAKEHTSLLERQRDRMRVLLKQGYVSTRELEVVETDLQQSYSAASAAGADLRIALAARQAADTGRYYTANRLEGELPALESQLSAADAEVALAESRLADLQRQVDRLTVRAPLGGRVRQLTVGSGSAVSIGSSMASLQTEDRSQVYALVPSHKLSSVVIGADATVTIPALSLSFAARVSGIEPRVWSLPDNVRRLLGNPTDAGLVILSFTEAGKATSDVHPGLPALVEIGNGPGASAARALTAGNAPN